MPPVPLPGHHARPSDARADRSRHEDTPGTTGPSTPRRPPAAGGARAPPVSDGRGHPGTPFTGRLAGGTPPAAERAAGPRPEAHAREARRGGGAVRRTVVGDGGDAPCANAASCAEPRWVPARGCGPCGPSPPGACARNPAVCSPGTSRGGNATRRPRARTAAVPARGAHPASPGRDGDAVRRLRPVPRGCPAEERRPAGSHGQARGAPSPAALCGPVLGRPAALAPVRPLDGRRVVAGALSRPGPGPPGSARGGGPRG